MNKHCRDILNPIKQLISQKKYIEAKQLITHQLKEIANNNKTHAVVSFDLTHNKDDNDESASNFLRSQLYFQMARVNNKMGFKQYVYDNYLRCREAKISVEHNKKFDQDFDQTNDDDNFESKFLKKGSYDDSSSPNSISIYLLMMDVFLYQFKSAYWANQVFSDLNRWELLDEQGQLSDKGRSILSSPYGKHLDQLKRTINEQLAKQEQSNNDSSELQSYDALMYYPRVTSEFDTSVRDNSEFFQAIVGNGNSRDSMVEVKQISNDNRGVFATGDIRKGQVIIDEEPFVQIGLTENTCIRCGYEIRDGEEKSVYCRNKRNDRLCGETLMDFREYFVGTTTELPKLALIFARLIGMQLERSDDGRLRDMYEAHPFLGLLIPSKVFEAQEKDKLKHVPMDLLPIQNLYNLFTERLEFTDEDYDQVPFEVFEKIVLTLVNYNYSYNDQMNYFVGHALSFVNHSCRPNATRSITKDGKRVLVTASRDIKQGEQVFITYFDPSTATPETSFMYGFSCRVNCLCKNLS